MQQISSVCHIQKPVTCFFNVRRKWMKRSPSTFMYYSSQCCLIIVMTNQNIEIKQCLKRSYMHIKFFLGICQRFKCSSYIH